MLEVFPPNSQYFCHTRNAKDRFGSEADLNEDLLFGPL